MYIKVYAADRRRYSRSGLFAAAVPEHIQIAEVLVMPANQATGTIVSRK